MRRLPRGDLRAAERWLRRVDHELRHVRQAPDVRGRGSAEYLRRRPNRCIRLHMQPDHVCRDREQRRAVRWRLRVVLPRHLPRRPVELRWQRLDDGRVRCLRGAVVTRVPVPSVANLGGSIVLFGGESFGVPMKDTWSYDGTSWTKLNVSGPPVRAVAAMATMTR